MHKSLGEMLPSYEQRNLYLDGDSAENFTELDKVYRKLKDCSQRWILQTHESKTDQTTSVTQGLNKAERAETLTNDRENCPEVPEELEKPESDSNAIKRHLMEKDIPVSDLKTEVSNMSVNSGEIRNGEHQIPNVPFTVMVTKDIRQEHKERQAEMEEGGDASP
jgi:hypothetical protein